MNIENERKYIIDSAVFQKIKDLYPDRQEHGIIQWYLNKPGEDVRRLRLEIIREKDAFRHVWTFTKKKKRNPLSAKEREEEEYTLDFHNLNTDHEEDLGKISRDLSILNQFPYTMKIRTLFPNITETAVVIDQFVTQGHQFEMSPSQRIMEIELNRENPTEERRFDETLKKLNVFGAVEDVTDRPEFENENMARSRDTKDSTDAHTLIGYLQNWLKGPTVMVSSQGLSLENNLNGQLKDKGWSLPKYEEIHRFLQDHGDILYVPKGKDNKKPLNTTLRDILDPNQKGFLPPEIAQKLCTELNTIHMVHTQGYQVEEVIFLVFPDKEGNYTDGDAPIVYRYLKALVQRCFPKIAVSKVQINFTPNMEESNFRSLETIWTEMETILNGNKKREMVIDPTGGHKIFAVIAALFAQLHHKPFYYVQEGSPVLYEFPAAPIQWDFARIDDDQPFFNECDRTISYAKYTQLPQTVKDLYTFLPKALDGGDHIVSILPVKKIMDAYKQAREMPFGYGAKFLELIEEDCWRQWIQEKTFTTWSLQWIGDQIPETVEHSQRHSKRLMEFTVNLIHTIGFRNFLGEGFPNKKEMEQEFLFMLGVAMNIHDLGHTNNVFSLKNGKTLYLDGLPGVVRDLHNELTVQMLTDPEGEKRYRLLDGLEEVLGKERSERMKKAITLICQYHRGHMPIDREKAGSNKTDSQNRKPFISHFELDTAPLVDRITQMFGDGDYDQNYPLWADLVIRATRWLKFIDSTDIQADRTLIPKYSEIRCQRTKDESIELINEYLYTVSQNHASIKGKLKEIQYLLGQITPDRLDLSLSKQLEDAGETIEEWIYHALADAIYAPNSSLRVIVPHELRMLARIAFKVLQFTHFLKHRSIQSVYPRVFMDKAKPGGTNKTLHLVYKINRSEYPQEGKGKGLFPSIQEEVEAEFNQAGIARMGSIEKLKIEHQFV